MHPMEIVITFGMLAVWLKKSIENDHFRAFSPMKTATIMILSFRTDTPGQTV